MKEEKAVRFEKESASRQGKMDRVKKGLDTITLVQQRTQVIRTMFVEEDSGTRTQMILKAPSAHIVATIAKRHTVMKEFFDKPQGWIQEDLFFEQASGTTAHRRGTSLVQDTSNKTVPDHLVSTYAPMQRLRFFEAATAEWTNNTYTAQGVFFSILRAPGHDIPKPGDPCTMLSRGSALTMTCSFDKKGARRIHSKGAQLYITKDR